MCMYELLIATAQTLAAKFTLRLFEPCGVNKMNFVNFSEDVSGRILLVDGRSHSLMFVAKQYRIQDHQFYNSH